MINSDEDISRLTFRHLDGNITLSPPTSALEEWYIQIRDTTLYDLKLDDLARACRQRLYLDQIVPICLHELEKNPLAGELYDGEVIYALKQVPEDYWLHNQIHLRRFINLTKLAFSQSGDPNLELTEKDLINRT